MAMKTKKRKRPLHWDEEKFQMQQTYLTRIKKMSMKDLRLLHKDTFAKMKPAFRPRIPPWVPRIVWERRLFLLFASRNYHLPKNGREAKLFYKQARDVLTHKFAGELDSIDKQVKRQLNKHSNFTRARIRSMTTDAVERYLIKLGYDWDRNKLSHGQLRKLLWEYFNLPASETWPKRVNRDGKKRRLQKPKNFAAPKLRDVIKENPGMDWHEFCEVFGETMPSVTHGSFRTTRWHLKREGYDIPTLHTGGAAHSSRREE